MKNTEKRNIPKTTESTETHTLHERTNKINDIMK